MKENTAKPTQTLWTRDFTILTLGTVVSMLGSTLSTFAMDLLILDLTGSTPLFALYGVLYMLPNTLSPILAGPFLDRFSRKRTIYTLDFLTAGIFTVLTAILALGGFSFGVLAAANLLLGAINGVYYVAYDSFYPLLISEGNFQKAYSISSTLETLTMVMVPLSTLIYKTVGIMPLFAVDALSYLFAAIMETQIRTPETYLGERDGESEAKGLRRFTADFKEGMAYLVGERGLFAIALYFFFSSLCGCLAGTVTLPYFKNTFENGEYVYMLTWGMASLARFLGGLVHYKAQLPVKAKFTIAFVVYVALALLEGTYLFFPVPVMMVMTFSTGMLGVTSYNIRISATQSYVPDGKKGRFNGAFNTLSTVGALLGESLAGILSVSVGERALVVGSNAVLLLAAVFIIGTHRQEVSRIYNTQA